MEDSIQPTTETDGTHCVHPDFEAMARQVAGQLNYPLDDNWRKKPFLCLLFDKAATANHALIAAALREAYEAGRLGDRTV